MASVIIDRPRRGGDGGKSILPKGSKKLLQQTPLEDQPKFASNAPRRLYGYFCKQLNEHLSPLRRWLEKQVGRDWDEVWSEVCDGLSVRNATTAHVRDHADYYVEKNCYIEDGKVYDSRGLPLNNHWRWKQFYIDPKDNTLQIAPEWQSSYRKPVEEPWKPGKDENHRYYLLGGVWYELALKPVPVGLGADWKPIKVHDFVIAALWDKSKPYKGSDRNDCKKFYGREVYAAAKRQVGKREIKKMKLR